GAGAEQLLHGVRVAVVGSQDQGGVALVIGGVQVEPRLDEFVEHLVIAEACGVEEVVTQLRLDLLGLHSRRLVLSQRQVAAEAQGEQKENGFHRVSPLRKARDQDRGLGLAGCVDRPVHQSSSSAASALTFFRSLLATLVRPSLYLASAL